MNQGTHFKIKSVFIENYSIPHDIFIIVIPLLLQSINQ